MPLEKNNSDHNFRPKKSLGQNFLRNRNVAEKIASLARDLPGRLIEIGPGRGALTEFLLDFRPDLLSVEIDRRACEVLKTRFPESDLPEFVLVNQDFLKFDLDKFAGEEVNFIGNLPYNVSSPILFKIFESRADVGKAIVMLQRELAKRLVARPRTKDYGILTLAAEFVGRAKIEFNVSPNCFYPKPEVTSAVVSIEFSPDRPEPDEFSGILQVVKAAFNQRRKTLGNSLKKLIESKTELSAKEFFEKNFEKRYSKMRAEELNKEDFIELYKSIADMDVN